MLPRELAPGHPPPWLHVGLSFSGLEVQASFPLDRVSLPFGESAWREASFPGVGWYNKLDEQSFYRVFDSLELHRPPLGTG